MGQQYSEAEKALEDPEVRKAFEKEYRDAHEKQEREALMVKIQELNSKSEEIL